MSNLPRSRGISLVAKINLLGQRMNHVSIADHFFAENLNNFSPLDHLPFSDTPLVQRVHGKIILPVIHVSFPVHKLESLLV